MHTLTKLTVTEAKLFARDLSNVFFVILLPTVLLAVFASIPGLDEPNPDLGGQRFVDTWVPSLVILSIVLLGFQVLPVYLATYRERGVLRRLSTTPVSPGKLLIAQLVVNLAAALVAIVLLLGVGAVVFDVALPRDGLGFAAALVLGTAATFAVGLVIAALVPSGRAATGVGTLLFLPTMFFGGLYVPRAFLPEGLARVGDWLPPGVQALQDGWTGTGPQPVHLLAMAAITVVLALVAARTFRWE